MRGFVRKRGSTWTAYHDVHEYDANSGTTLPKQRSKGGFATQRAAQAHLNSVLQKVEAGTYTEPSRQPLAEYLRAEWLPAISAQVRPLTSYRYERIVGAYIDKSDIAAMPLRSIAPGAVNALYAKLEPDGLSVATRRLVHAVLRRALGDAVRWEKLSRNPAALANAPALPSARAKAWTTSELRRFLAHAADDRLAALWRLGATTGMRRGELLGLKWEFVDLDVATLRVEQQLVPLKSGVGFGPPKSRRSRRTVALDSETVEALRRHQAAQLIEQSYAGAAYGHDDLVFADELGGPLRPATISDRFLTLRKGARISVGTMHVMRHTAATIALTEGVPLHVVAARIGDDPKTVLSNYAHLLPHSDSEAAQVVAAALADKAMTNEPDCPIIRGAA